MRARRISTTAPMLSALALSSRWSATGARALCAVGRLLADDGGAALAANQSVQGAPKKEDNAGFQTDAPMAILIDAESGSVLFEKNADQLAPPSSMMKMMTVEYVFNELKAGRIKLTDEYRVSENAWRKGGAPSGGSTMFAGHQQQRAVQDLLYGRHRSERATMPA